MVYNLWFEDESQRIFYPVPLVNETVVGRGDFIFEEGNYREGRVEEWYKKHQGSLGRIAIKRPLNSTFFYYWERISTHHFRFLRYDLENSPVPELDTNFDVNDATVARVIPVPRELGGTVRTYDSLFEILDNNSKNGTYVNGIPVGPNGAFIQDRGIVRLGGYDLVFRMSDVS